MTALLLLIWPSCVVPDLISCDPTQLTVVTVLFTLLSSVSLVCVLLPSVLIPVVIMGPLLNRLLNLSRLALQVTTRRTSSDYRRL